MPRPSERHATFSALSDMKPYFDDGQVTLYCGDCRDVLPRLAPASVHLLLTDPPYGVGFTSHGRRVEAFGPMVGDDGTLNVEAALRSAVRVLRNGRHLYVFGTADLTGFPLGGRCGLIWDKGTFSGGDLDNGWAMAHEPIQFGVYVPLPAAVRARRGDGERLARLRRGSVLRYQRPSGSSVRRHPTEKPVALLRELIEMSSRPGEVVLDPFAGSGSTGVAAALEGRRALLVEVDERYCEVAADRLRRLQRVLPGLEETA